MDKYVPFASSLFTIPSVVNGKVVNDFLVERRNCSWTVLLQSDLTGLVFGAIFSPDLISQRESHD